MPAAMNTAKHSSPKGRNAVPCIHVLTTTRQPGAKGSTQASGRRVAHEEEFEDQIVVIRPQAAEPLAAKPTGEVHRRKGQVRRKRPAAADEHDGPELKRSALGVKFFQHFQHFHPASKVVCTRASGRALTPVKKT